jgi:DNA (cytosine-5)-methyltransferase 1
MKKAEDLFAGCGGMSLDLEMVGFQTVHVNELHPDALAKYLLERKGALRLWLINQAPEN